MFRPTLLLATLTAALAAAEPPATVTVQGVVRSPEAQAPLAGARVACRGGASALADAEGRFALTLPIGEEVCEVSAAGYVSASVRVAAQAETAPLEITLASGRFREAVDVRAALGPTGEAPSTLPVSPSQVQHVAGAAENVFRVLQTLPGVAATEDFGSRLAVRGGGPDQNLTVMDGVELHNPYRLFGLTSAFNPETVESFELTAGAFSARYGDRLSSLLVVDNRTGDPSRAVSGSAALSVTDSNVILQGRLPRQGGWLVTGRRTYYDLVAERFTDEDLPSFADVQASLALPLGRGHTLQLQGLRSRESTDATFHSENAGDYGGVLTGARNDVVAASIRSAFRRGTARTLVSWYRNSDGVDFDGRFRNVSRRSNGPDDDASFSVVSVAFGRDYVVRDLAFREDLSYQAGARHRLDAGFELHGLRTAWALAVTGDRNDNIANGSNIRGGAGLPDHVDSALDNTRAGGWLQDRFQATSSLAIEAGLRWDRSSVNGDSELSPRLTALYDLKAGTRLKLALGRHTQSPGYEKLLQDDYFVNLTGAPLPLRNERALHAVLGLERDLAPGVVARVEGYYKTFDDLVIGRLETEAERQARVATYDFPKGLAWSVPTAAQITTVPGNDGRGRAYGVEVYVARTASSADTRLTGWVSYSYGVARRTEYGHTYPFDYDRRHAVSLVGSFRVSRRLELSATERVASGFPRTPVQRLRVAAVAIAPDELVPERDQEGRLVYVPDYGTVADLNSARFPLFARLDLRATWTPRWGSGRWQLYLDVINVLDRKNASSLVARLEYDPNGPLPRLVETREGSIPLLPSIGVHVRF